MKAVTGDNASYETTAKFKETLQNDYNEIVMLIYNAKGYYVGRYETSNMTTTANTSIKAWDTLIKYPKVILEKSTLESSNLRRH